MKPTLLLLDSDAKLLELYRLELEAEGYDLHLALNAGELDRKLQNNRYDVIILDLRMPQETEIDALRNTILRNPGATVLLNTTYHFYRRNLLAWKAHLVRSRSVRDLKLAIKKVLAVRFHQDPAFELPAIA